MKFKELRNKFSLTEMKTFDQLYKGPPKKSQLLEDVQQLNKQWKNTKTKDGPYGGINDITIRFSAPPTGNVIEPDPRFKSIYPDGEIESDYKLGIKHAKDMLRVAQRLSSREPYKSAFEKPSMIDDPIQIYIGHQYKGDYNNNPKYKVDITPIIEEIAKISHKKEPAANARMKDISGFYGGMSESVVYERPITEGKNLEIVIDWDFGDPRDFAAEWQDQGVYLQDWSKKDFEITLHGEDKALESWLINDYGMDKREVKLVLRKGKKIR